MIKAFSQSVRQALDKVWPLYGAAFWMSLGMNALWTVMPFIIRNIGGTKVHVGYAWAFYMLGYLACLLFAAAKLDHLNQRRTTRGAAAVMAMAAFVMLVIVYYAISRGRLNSPAVIWTVIAAGTVLGGAMSFYWPYLMAWVSADYEGAILNRRLGTYNGMWSSAGMIGPAVGGILVAWNTPSPVALSTASLATCFLLLCLARDGAAGTAASAKPLNAPEVVFDKRLLISLKWMARISMFCSWLCMSIARSQFPLLFTDIGFTESQFGVLVMIFGLCNFLILTGAGRVGFWHFKPVLLLGVQIALAVSSLLLIFGRSLWAFVPSFAILGGAFGFAYSSHLYYGTCGSRKRSRQMAIHEVTISLGVIIGSGTGGYLADKLGDYHPYWFAVAVMVLGLLAQTAIWSLSGQKPGPKL